MQQFPTFHQTPGVAGPPRGLQSQAALYLSVLLRLAVLLHRSHNEHAPRIERIKPGKNRLELRFTETDLAGKRPLLLADLEREQAFLAAVDFTLSF